MYAQKSVDGLFDGLFDAAGKKDRQRRRALTVFLNGVRDRNYLRGQIPADPIPGGVARLKNGKNERPSNLCAYTKNEKKKSVDGLFEKTVKKTVNALLRIHSSIVLRRLVCGYCASKV